MSGPISLASFDGVENLDALDRDLEEFHEAFVGALFDQDPRTRAAVLARVVKDGVGRHGRRLLEVGVGENDVRALAPEFERDAFDLFGAARHDLAPRLVRTGEAHLAHRLVGHEAVTHRSAVTDET